MMYTVHKDSSIRYIITMKPLTAQQQKVVGFVEDFSRDHGFPPTLREIGEAIDLANINAVRGHLSALEKKGYITRLPDKARSIQIVHSPSRLSRLKRRIHEVLRTDKSVFHRVVYGLAWTTWQGRPYLTGRRRELISEAIDSELVEHGWDLIEKRIERDHIVVVVVAWPNHSPEQTVRRFQVVGRAVRRHHPEEFPAERLWGTGYAATTELDLLDKFVAQLLDNQVPGETEQERQLRAPECREATDG